MDLDTVVFGGSIVSGEAGTNPERADIGIAAGVIVGVGDLAHMPATERIDVSGLVVTPGFIDAHIHSEYALLHGDPADRFGALLQGVTSHATAADGFGWAPLPQHLDGGPLWRSTTFAYGCADLVPNWSSPNEYLARFENCTPVNLIPFAPHQAIRYAAMGWRQGTPSLAEMGVQIGALRNWLDAGAFGLATGLDYQPAASASTNEIVTLAQLVSDTGGVYAPHIRYTQLGRVRAYQESIEIGRRARIPVAICHEIVDDVTQPIIDGARNAGVDLTIDWYCYPAGCTTLLLTLHTDDYVGGPDAVLERLRDASYRKRVASRMEDYILRPEEPGSSLYFADTRTGSHIGRTIPDIAHENGLSVGEMAVRLLESELPDLALIYRRGISSEAFENEVRRTVTHPAWSLTSDGFYHGQRPHPRGYGAFARFLRVVVRELNVLDLGEAVHRMTGAVAQRLRLKDRGYIRAGQAADLVALNPATVSDRSTWEAPRMAPDGIEFVMVNGILAVKGGLPTGCLAGRVLYRDV